MRLRIVSVERSHHRGSSVEITVRLEGRDGIHEARREGVGGAQVELRLASEATLDAVHEAADRTSWIQFLGIKTVRAFDREIVLVSVRSEDEPSRHLVGAVPEEDDRLRTAVAATLDAVNRLLARRLEERAGRITGGDGGRERSDEVAEDEVRESPEH